MLTVFFTFVTKSFFFSRGQFESIACILVRNFVFAFGVPMRYVCVTKMCSSRVSNICFRCFNSVFTAQDCA